MSDPSQRPRLAYISILAERGAYDLARYVDPAEGADDRDWFAARLAELGLADAFDVVAVDAANGASLPAADSVDIAVIGGSLHSVSEERRWQRRIWDWLPAYRRRGAPLLGICGGHQMIARAGGVPVTVLDDGPWAGSLPVRLSPAGAAHALFRDHPAEPRFHFGNNEHVSRPPTGAEVLAAVDGSPCLALDHGGDWLSVQFHPEATGRAMARAWLHTAPENARNYVETPDGPTLLRNFLSLVAGRA